MAKDKSGKKAKTESKTESTTVVSKPSKSDLKKAAKDKTPVSSKEILANGSGKVNSVLSRLRRHLTLYLRAANKN
jgi:hypothetical protein